MKQVTRNSANCLLNGGNKKFDNTLIETADGYSRMYLYGNIIAIYNLRTKVLKITNAGWFTKTTKERLNALPNVRIHQHKWEWYLNGIKWDGSLINV